MVPLPVPNAPILAKIAAVDVPNFLASKLIIDQWAFPLLRVTDLQFLDRGWRGAAVGAFLMGIN
jgi:hypothetical protein